MAGARRWPVLSSSHSSSLRRAPQRLGASRSLSKTATVSGASTAISVVGNSMFRITGSHTRRVISWRMRASSASLTRAMGL